MKVESSIELAGTLWRFQYKRPRLINVPNIGTKNAHELYYVRYINGKSLKAYKKAPLLGLNPKYGGLGLGNAPANYTSTKLNVVVCSEKGSSYSSHRYLLFDRLRNKVNRD